MKTKTEQFAYLDVVRTVAKSRVSSNKGYVFAKGDLISAFTTDGIAVTARVEGGNLPQGRYSVLVIEAIKQGRDTALYFDRDQLAIFDLEPAKYTRQHPVTKELGNQLVKSLLCVSQDPTRPALQKAAVEEDWLMSTDGYRAFITKAPLINNLQFHPEILRFFRKLRKYGTWTIHAGKTEHGSEWVSMGNGDFRICSYMDELPFPRVMDIAKITDPYDTLVTIPVSDLCKYADKRFQNISIDDQETISLTDGTGEKIATPIKATIEHVKPFCLPTTFTSRTIVMPLADTDHLGVSLPLIRDLADREGNITLAYRKGSLTPLYVVE